MQHFADTFWEQVRIAGPDECWQWLGGTGNGHGRICHPDIGRQSAHRVAYILAHGDVTKGANILHSCKNALCCNPAHLRLAKKKTPHAPLEIRLWSRVKRGAPDECWEWQGLRHPTGYGAIHAWQKSRYTHRVAYILTHGPIPDDMFVCHSCDNPPCCNPAHLWVGTPADNVHDRDRKGRTHRGPRKKKTAA